MAGNDPASRMSRELAAVRFAVATPQDDAAIRRLLRDNPMPGEISLSMEREPDYFRGTGVAGSDDETIVAYEDGKLVCIGRCSHRDCWINGERARAGYLAELRLDASAQRRVSILRDGYRLFQERQLSTETQHYFTSIAADNVRARRILEKGIRGMPVYGFLAELTTLVIAVPRRLAATKIELSTPTPADLPEIVHVLNEQGRQYQFATSWTEDNLRTLARHGLLLSCFRIVRETGRIAAVGALWDQRPFRQTVIRGYVRKLILAKPLINVAAALFGAFRLPAVGSTLANAFVCPLACTVRMEARWPDFIEGFFSVAREFGVEMLTLCFPADDERIPVMRKRFATRIYHSRLYQVSWRGEKSVAVLAPKATFLPDIALL